MSTEGSVPRIAQAAPRAATTSVPAVAPHAPPATASPAPFESTTAEHPFRWHGSPWSLAGLCLRNTLLAVLTLGVYSFWGRTEMRRRIWSNIRFYDEPLAYHGTPRELMRGFMTVLVAVLVPLFLMGIVVTLFFGHQSAIAAAYQFGLLAILYPILGAIAFYRGRRYRLSRTSWRGIRASLTGSSGAYAAYSWLTMAAIFMTMFWIIPYRAVALQRMIVNDTQLGNARLSFTGTAGPVYRRYAMLWFGTILLFVGTIGAVGVIIGGRAQPTNPLWWASIRARDVFAVLAVCIGAVVVWSLISSFYFARLYNYLAQETFVIPHAADRPAMRFNLDVSGKGIIWLFVTNTLITYLSLYVLKPVAMARTMKYYTDHLSLVGPFDPAAIGQNTVAFDPTGEGLAQAFDLDAF